MLTDMNRGSYWFTIITCWLQGIVAMEPHEGAYNQLWCAAGAKKEELRNGGFYRPVGVDETANLVGKANDPELARKLWEWTEGVLKKSE